MWVVKLNNSVENVDKVKLSFNEPLTLKDMCVKMMLRLGCSRRSKKI